MLGPRGTPCGGRAGTQRWYRKEAEVLDSLSRSSSSGPCLAAALTQHLVSIRHKALAHQGGRAAGAGEAAVVPVSLFKGYVLASTESCEEVGVSSAVLDCSAAPSQPYSHSPACPLTTPHSDPAHTPGPTCDGALATAALGCKEFSKTGYTVGVVLPGGELLPCQGCLAPGADQALTMPGLVTVCHPTLRQCLERGDNITSRLSHAPTIPLLPPPGPALTLLQRAQRGANLFS